MAYYPARKCKAKKGVTTLRCTDGTFERTANEFDCTNVAGDEDDALLLAEEFDCDTSMTTLNFGIVVKTTDVPTYVPGVHLNDVTYVDPKGNVYSGEYVITKVGEAISVKGAWKLSLTGKFTGKVTRTAGP